VARTYCRDSDSGAGFSFYGLKVFTELIRGDFSTAWDQLFSQFPKHLALPYPERSFAVLSYPGREIEAEWRG